MVEYENGDGGSVNVNFEVADVLVAVGELPHMTWKLRDSRSSDEKPASNLDLEHSMGPQ